MARNGGLSLSNVLGFYLEQIWFLDCGSYRSGCLAKGGYRGMTRATGQDLTITLLKWVP
jgi:hypothetical protein